MEGQDIHGNFPRQIVCPCLTAPNLVLLASTIRQTVCHVNHFNRSILKIFPLETQSPGLAPAPDTNILFHNLLDSFTEFVL